MFSVLELQRAELSPPLKNSKGCPVLRLPGYGRKIRPEDFGTKLFNVKNDPYQEEPLSDPLTEARMERILTEELEKAAAPPEQFDRLGLKRALHSETAQIISEEQP